MSYLDIFHCLHGSCGIDGSNLQIIRDSSCYFNWSLLMFASHLQIAFDDFIVETEISPDQSSSFDSIYGCPWSCK